MTADDFSLDRDTPLDGDDKGWKVRRLYQMEANQRGRGKRDLMTHRLCGSSVSRRIDQQPGLGLGDKT